MITNEPSDYQFRSKNATTEGAILKELDKHFYFVLVPQISLLSEYELKTQGINIDFVNGNPDKKTINRLTTVRLPLRRILYIYESGYAIYLKDKKDLFVMGEVLRKLQYQLDNATSFTETPIRKTIKKFISEFIELNHNTFEEEERKQDAFDDGLFMSCNRPVRRRRNRGDAALDISDVGF